MRNVFWTSFIMGVLFGTSGWANCWNSPSLEEDPPRIQERLSLRVLAHLALRISFCGNVRTPYEWGLNLRVAIVYVAIAQRQA